MLNTAIIETVKMKYFQQSILYILLFENIGQKHRKVQFKTLISVNVDVKNNILIVVASFEINQWTVITSTTNNSLTEQD